jgi:hypothetical protein
MAGACPIGVRITARMEKLLARTHRPVLVIPGLDPGISSTDRVRFDPRITSGDDEDDKSCLQLDPILMPMGPVPAICAQAAPGGWPEHVRP